MKRTSLPRGKTRAPAKTQTRKTSIRYSIVPSRPEAHLFTVSVTVDAPDPQGQKFMLPAWIPGSYMIREFTKNIVTLSAASRGKPVPVEKTAKAEWLCAPVKGPLTLTYEVYAWDLSVRAAHLDETHAFFNGTSVFLLPLGFEDAPCEVDIRPPEGEAFLVVVGFGSEQVVFADDMVGNKIILSADICPLHKRGLYDEP